ncbi:MAG: poly-gamma-glutamate synthase PgsB [Candidatus Aminicenantes bacterium]|nr:poly-gamma-glutamate synthase PgsB [Candidatus Aminicenantes bacterium]
MNPLLLITAVLIALAVLFFLEKKNQNRRLRRIPLRICVTGTRGKSSVTRMLVCVLRASGKKVVARTTGSEPILHLPDGTEHLLHRRGMPNILEGKRIVQEAVRREADVLVTELMAVRPETLHVESALIFQPHLLVLTNSRADHLDTMGASPAKIAAALTAAFPPGGTVFLPEEEMDPIFERAADERGAVLIGVSPDEVPLRKEGETYPLEFSINRRLCAAVARRLDVPDEEIKRGLARYEPDFGALQVWELEADNSRETALAVSAFAANDPLSTRMALESLKERTAGYVRRIGLLNLRPDRGDRTRQWQSALLEQNFLEIDEFVLLGEPVRPVQKKLRAAGYSVPCVFGPGVRPDVLMNNLFDRFGGGFVLLGVGNMAGAAARLVRHWEKTGKRS